MFDTPILFIIYNRPGMTSQVFESIRNIKPKKLYIAADGPKTPETEPDCLKARECAIVDWPCDLKLLYRTNNLGCKLAVSSAISWFFDNETEGIILEDDTLPNDSFFYYCSCLLKKYRCDNRIFSVSGCNFGNPEFVKKYNYSYFYSRYWNMWGWATWKRSWQKYNINFSPASVKFGRRYFDFFDWMTFDQKKYWQLIMEYIGKGKIDTWDYQFLYNHWENNAFTCVPSVNLVRNIGFGSAATNTHDFNHYLGKLTNEIQLQLPVISPDFFMYDSKFDSKLCDLRHEIPKMPILNRIYRALADLI